MVLGYGGIIPVIVANGLSALVASNPEFDFSGWDLIASSIIRKSHHVQLLGLAPNDVVKFVYPLEGNEAVLGLNYQSIPSQWRSVKKAQQIQDVFISGPVNLVQGGKALIARVPIFSDPPYNTDYWGVCSMVISLDSLFSEAGVASFEHRYNLAMRGADSSGSEGEVFYGFQTTFDQAFASEFVYFPYGSWQIAASTKSDLLSGTEYTWLDCLAIR